MPFHPVPQCSECQVRWAHGSNQYECGFAYKWNSTVPPTSAELTTLATEVRDTIGVKMQQMTTDSNSFREVHCYNLDVALGNQATVAFPTNARGTRGGDPAAASNAVNIVKRTGLRGRSGHGANRVSDFSEGDLSGNTIQSYIITAGANLILSIIASRAGGRFLAGLKSLHLSQVIPIVAGIILDTDIDSQKTRLNRHGSS